MAATRDEEALDASDGKAVEPYVRQNNSPSITTTETSLGTSGDTKGSISDTTSMDDVSPRSDPADRH